MDYRELAQMELEVEAFPPVRHDFRIYISEESFDRICAGANTTREVGGILVGDVLCDDGGPYIRAETIIEALHAEEAGTELTLTHATWSHIHEQMDSTYAGKRIIGWYHTHPNFGIFLSDRDRFIQQSFFNLPFQIALVYDPVRREHGVFTWKDSRPWRARQYWIGTHEHRWDDARETADVANRRQQELVRHDRAKARAAADEPPTAQLEMPDHFWILGAAMIGLLIGLLLGSRFVGQGGVTNEKSQTVQEAVASLDNDLVSILRGTVSDEALSKNLDDSINRLEQAAEAIKPLEVSNPAAKNALQSVAEAQQSLGRMRNDRRIAQAMLNQIEQITRQTDRTSQSVMNELKEQRAVLGAVYADLAQQAARDKDEERVSRLLATAARLDPEQRAKYEEQLKAFNPQLSLPQQPDKQ